MKVLITGGYGFIGSHVAEQFFKEGYEVHIIDNLSTGKKENLKIKHHSYLLSVDDKNCKNIFESHQFDVVVHLAAQVSVSLSIENPVYDAQMNIIGLLNMLQLSKQVGVKKFIFSSSAAVYGNNPDLPLKESNKALPISPYGMSKWSGEQYCLNYTEQHQLQTICFRFSNVYGPRQTSEGEGGVISIFTEKVIENKKLQVYGDGNQTRDFIYVKDLAFAIYRASQSILTGVYNLSTNTQVSINEIIRNFEVIHGQNIPVEYTASRIGDIYHSSLDNTKIKNALDWSPIYSIEEGLSKTYEWMHTVKDSNTIETIEKEKFQLPNWFQSIKSYIENTVLFVILSILVLNVPFISLSTFLFGIFYIISIGSINGNTQAFFAVILSIALLVYNNIHNGRELISLLYDTNFLFQIATFLFFGLMIGYSVQRKNNKIAEQKEQIEELINRNQFLEVMHNDVREVKNELQYRLRTSEDSIGKIYSIIKELDDLEPEKIMTKTVKVIEEIMHCDSVSIYTFNNYKTFLRLVAQSDFKTDISPKNSIKVKDAPFVQKMILSERIYINRNLEIDSPLMAAPIFYGKELKAIITLNNLPFEKLTTYHENLFYVAKELIQSSLSRALDFTKISEDQRYIENTKVLQMDVFNEILHIKEEAKAIYNMPYVLLTIYTTIETLKETAFTVEHLLRETDYLGFNNDQLYILLSNMNETDLPIIQERFLKVGFAVKQPNKGLLL